MDNNRLCNKCGLLPQNGKKPEPCTCKPKCKKPCKKKCCGDGFAFRKVVIPSALGDDITGKDKPVNGAYTNSYVEYEANGAQYMYDSLGIFTKMESGEVLPDFNELINRPKYAGIEMTGETDIPDVSSAVSAEANVREHDDNELQRQIDALSAASDVTDIVGTYAALQAYDTSTLKDNDIIKVLQDETHDDETTYYRWSKSSETFALIGEEGPYYTKAAADQKFQDKLVAGTNITIDQLTNTISATANGQTIFYTDSTETGNSRHIYKNSDMTDAASAQDILDANEGGQVILRLSTASDPTLYNDSYLQNTYIGVGDYQFLFLDNRFYYEYDATQVGDTVFYYSRSEIQFKLTFDNTPTTGSNNPVTSNGIKSYVDTNAVGETESYTVATADWSALSSSAPYDYSATVTATYTIGANTICELINDDAVSFSNHGFAIGDITGQSVTFYSIGVPSANVTLKVNYKG